MQEKQNAKMQNAKCKMQNAKCDVSLNPERKDNVSENFRLELQTYFFSYQKLVLHFAFCILQFCISTSFSSSHSLWSASATSQRLRKSTPQFC